MDYQPLALGMITLFMFQVSSAEPSAMDLVTFESPPYQFARPTGRTTAEIAGETVNTITCAAKQADWPVQISLAPQKRAIYSLKRDRVDGYFAATPSEALDAIATKSHAIAVERWSFFSLSPDITPGKSRIGVVDGSNEEAWLKNHGYDIYLVVTYPGQLMALLRRGRIDTALMDQRAMETLESESDPEAETLHAHFLRYAPLHLYVSESFHRNHPQFLPRFNRALPLCQGRPPPRAAGKT